MTKIEPRPLPLIYHDGKALYLEFPTHALRFPYTEGGLHKALSHIPSIASQPGYLTGGRNLTDPPPANGKIARVSRATARARTIRNFSPAQRAAAAEIVRKMKG